MDQKERELQKQQTIAGAVWDGEGYRNELSVSIASKGGHAVELRMMVQLPKILHGTEVLSSHGRKDCIRLNLR